MSKVEITTDMLDRAVAAMNDPLISLLALRTYGPGCTGQATPEALDRAKAWAALDAALNPPEIVVTPEMQAAGDELVREYYPSWYASALVADISAKIYRAMRKLEPEPGDFVPYPGAKEV